MDPLQIAETYQWVLTVFGDVPESALIDRICAYVCVCVDTLQKQ